MPRLKRKTAIWHFFSSCQSNLALLIAQPTRKKKEKKTAAVVRCSLLFLGLLRPFVLPVFRNCLLELLERRRSIEHSTHNRNAAGLPLIDRLVERRRSIEHSTQPYP